MTGDLPADQEEINMKKQIVCFCLTVFLLLPFAARAEEYAGFLLNAPDAESMLDWTVYPLDAHNVIVYSRPLDLDHTPARWTWYRDGEIRRDLAFMARGPQRNWCGARFMLAEDGQVKALIPTYLGDSGAVMNAGGDEYPIARWEALDWTENGFENPIELFTGVREMNVCGSSVLSADCLLDGPRIVYLHDAAGAEIWRCLLPVSHTFRVDRMLDMGGGLYLIAGHESGDWLDRKALFIQDGVIVRALDAYADGWPDGQGGLIAVEGRFDTQLFLRHLDEDLQETWRGVLTGGETVKNIFGAAANPDGTVTLYGAAVANSRKFYTVFALTVNQRMEIAAQDVRDLSPDYQDYSPAIYLAPDGSPWVFTQDGSLWHNPPALIPFDRLPSNPLGASLHLQAIEARD